MSNSCDLHGLQHTRLPWPSLFPGVCPNSCPLSRWCHPTISSSIIPFSSHLQSFPASGSFPMSWFFTLGGQSIGVSASVSVLPMNIHDWFSLGLAGLISLLSKGLSRVFSSTTIQRHRINSLACAHDEVYIMTHRYMQYYLNLKFTQWGIKNAYYMYILQLCTNYIYIYIYIYVHIYSQKYMNI